MMHLRVRVLTAIIALFALAPVARLYAVTLDNNNTPSKATVLPGGQLIVSDDLNGAAGRAATLLGQYDPQFQVLSLVSTPAVTINGFGSQLLGVPLRPNGSAYFRVTGAGDATFGGNHTQSGRYSIEYKIYNAAHTLVETKPLEFENVSPHTIDNIWLDPQIAGDPNRIGGTVDVLINTIVGPGTGDSLDFFLFSGMQPFQAFTALLTGDTFDARIGLFNTSNALVTSSNPLAAIPLITGFADNQGRAKIGVSGAVDALFKGEHTETGTYTLQVIPAAVPEPSSAVLLALGAALGGLALRKRRRARVSR